jgi:hypothetical protein
MSFAQNSKMPRACPVDPHAGHYTPVLLTRKLDATALRRGGSRFRLLAFLIALDVFVLSLCVFWMMREAFLSPVTIEELDALRTDKHPQKQLAAGTRGWYDHASEPVNFLIPLLVTLMFVAIEAIVLRAW